MKSTLVSGTMWELSHGTGADQIVGCGAYPDTFLARVFHCSLVAPWSYSFHTHDTRSKSHLDFPSSFGSVDNKEREDS